MTVVRPTFGGGYRAPAPVIRISAPRAVSAPRKKHHRRRVGSGDGGKNAMWQHALGGAALGFAEKSGITKMLPQIPMLGVKGTFAAAGYFLGLTKKPGIMRDAVLAAATLAGYELGKDGKVSGDVDGDD